jgi:four helix bundle protein
MKPENLRDRTFRFALSTVEFSRQLPATRDVRRIAGQLIDAATSVGANYRAAQRGRSKKEFIAKIGLVIEEADESAYWLELLEASGLARGLPLEPLLQEARELRAIFVKSWTTARSNGPKKMIR